MFTLTHLAIDIAIVCSDFKQSLHFYRDLLGLEEVLDIDIPASTATGAGLAPSGFRQVRLRAGTTRIKLMQIEPSPEPRSDAFQAGVRWLTFIVDDVPGTVAGLAARGVEFLADPVAAPDAKYVVCAEGPDGVLIEFVELLDEGP